VSVLDGDPVRVRARPQPRGLHAPAAVVHDVAAQQRASSASIFGSSSAMYGTTLPRMSSDATPG
jgi:hypothetical protein